MNLTENHTNQDDEIDLVEVFKTIWDSKKTIVLITSIIILISLVISINSTKYYKSTTTFHINEENSANGLAGYAGMLGINANSNLNNIVNSLLKSNKIKEETAKKFQYALKSKIESAISKNKLNNSPEHIIAFTIDQLKLKQNISISNTKEGLIKLSYLSNSPELSQNILNYYLKLLDEFNTKLEISAEKNFLTIIDSPNKALAHFKPNLKLNLVLAFLLGLGLSSVYVLIKHSFSKKN